MRPPDLVLTGPVTVSRPTGECRSQGPPASHSKDNPQGVSRFASQAEPRELTNRRIQPQATAIHHDQRTPTSSLPVLCGRFTSSSDGCCVVMGASTDGMTAAIRSVGLGSSTSTKPR